jgi:hypothetical protein
MQRTCPKTSQDPTLERLHSYKRAYSKAKENFLHKYQQFWLKHYLLELWLTIKIHDSRRSK